ncbi:MAG: MFS transporter [Saprospiraceae bacterium]
MQENARSYKLLNAAVIVAALGYFVDIYDLLLFGFVRVRSLSDLGYSGQELTDVGISLLNWQMIGMLIGGVLWGVLGDRLGRISVLYFSILMYSVANILNGFVHSGESYALYRFIAGVGLAGELGAGITLVSEVLPKEKRGYGTMLVACIGLSGALLAWVINHFFSWQTCYFIGGGMGFLLLGLRLKVNESGIFERVKQDSAIRKGDFLSLFSKRERFVRFARCLFVGAPTWFVVGILVTLAPEFGAAKGLDGISAANAIASCYGGLILGDVASGLLSQFWRSRLKVMAFFLSLDALAIAYYLYAGFTTPGSMYFAHFLLGFSVGFWVIFVTIGAEQFGANLRATVATSVPNFARGLLVPIAASFRWLKGPDGLGDLIAAATVVGAVCLLIAFASLYGMQETFDKDMNYVET